MELKEYLDSKKIKSFVNGTNIYIKKISLKQYNQYVNTLINEITKKDTSRIDEFNRYSETIFNNSYIFNIREHLAKTLKNISHDDIYQFYNKYFVKETKKLRIIEFYKNLFKKCCKKID